MTLTGEELAQELHRRALIRTHKDSLEMCRAQAHLVEQYDYQLVVDSFTPKGLELIDESGRTVGTYDVVTNEGYIRSYKPKHTDVAILVQGGMVLGWTSHVEDLQENGFSLNAKSLKPMTKVFDFAEPCPHLSVHGGWFDTEEGGWFCFGCSRILPSVLLNHTVGASKS